MTTNSKLKSTVRARAARTGESYTAALRHVRPDPGPRPLRVAAAVTRHRPDPGDIDALSEGGAEVRERMRAARAAGARVLLLPEGAICSPAKRVMSSLGPDTVGPADWSRCRWDVLRAELRAVAALAGELRLWTVLGAPHALTPPRRPHNSMYVLDDRGRIATRYDERLLSRTKLDFMYTPGSRLVTFEVDGVPLGVASGMEVHFPEMFVAYEGRGVAGVLFGTAAAGTPEDDAVFALEARAHAATNSFWVAYAGPDGTVPAGVAGPDGSWVARGDLAVADLAEPEGDFSRPWRRIVRDGVHRPHLAADDPRSTDRRVF